MTFSSFNHVLNLTIKKKKKARIIETGKLAAVKIIIIEPGENLDDVMVEVNMLKECHHNNIVSYYGCYFRQGSTKGEDSIWV